MMTNLLEVGQIKEPKNMKYLEWKIPNFHYWSRYPYPQTFLTSPSFFFKGTFWHISLRPYDNLSMFLVNEFQCPRNVNYSFSIKESTGTLLSYSTNNATIKNKSGFMNFFDANRLWSEKVCLLPSNTLTIVCMLTPGLNREEVFNNTAPKAGRMASSREIVGELSESNNLKQLEWNVPFYSFVSQYTFPRFLVISPTFTFENICWHISLCPCDDPSIFLVNETQRPCNINFSFSLKESKGMLLACLSNNATIGDKSGFYSFYDADFLRKHRLLSSDTLTIVCILKSGESQKQVIKNTALKTNNCSLKSEVESLKLMKLTETDVLSKNLKDIFINKKYCDTILRVKGREFHAHKIILMARSSVFSAMFQQDTPERRTGTVDIPDCDSGIFQEFLAYLYSGKLEDISLGSTLQLYSTAHKYNVQELKLFCKKSMIQNLTVQNICDVITLADKYGEITLSSAAQEYFNDNFKTILKTSEWENFIKNNYRLVNKLFIAMSGSKE